MKGDRRGARRFGAAPFFTCAAAFWYNARASTRRGRVPSEEIPEERSPGGEG